MMLFMLLFFVMVFAGRFFVAVQVTLFCDGVCRAFFFLLSMSLFSFFVMVFAECSFCCCSCCSFFVMVLVECSFYCKVAFFDFLL